MVPCFGPDQVGGWTLFVCLVDKPHLSRQDWFADNENLKAEPAGSFVHCGLEHVGLVGFVVGIVWADTDHSGS